MNHDDYVDLLESNGAALAVAARSAAMDAPVPSCPEWDVHALLAHMGGHHRWVDANLHQAPEDGVVRFRDVERAPDGDAVIAWVEAGVAALAGDLRAMGPDQPCWTWVDYDSTTGFWSRRTALETAVHRWDAQNAAGPADMFEPATAVDGIDEYLTITPLRFWGEQPEATGQTIHVHATDAPGEWLVRLDADGMHVTAEHAKGDVAMRGPASDLYLVLLNRLPASTVDVFGDDQFLARWLEQTSF